MSDDNLSKCENIFHEVWWIYAPDRHPWGGLKTATFRKTINGDLIFIINQEWHPSRIGLRVWADVSEREGWVKVTQIAIPTRAEIEVAVEMKLRKIASDIKKEMGFD